MEKITINKHNTEKAYAAFQTGKIAVATDGKYHGIIKYDDSARTGANGEYKWSECAFGNMLISLLNGVINEIYIINPLNKNIFNTYEEMMHTVKENATHIIVKEENTMIKNNNISNERLYNLIENAINWASEVSEQTAEDLIKAMEITSDELCVFGFEKEEN